MSKPSIKNARRIRSEHVLNAFMQDDPFSCLCNGFDMCDNRTFFEKIPRGEFRGGSGYGYERSGYGVGMVRLKVR
jgi:hypothetical protein